jgi:hypothetical protein
MTPSDRLVLRLVAVVSLTACRPSPSPETKPPADKGEVPTTAMPVPPHVDPAPVPAPDAATSGSSSVTDAGPPRGTIQFCYEPTGDIGTGARWPPLPCSSTDRPFTDYHRSYKAVAGPHQGERKGKPTCCYDVVDTGPYSGPIPGRPLAAGGHRALTARLASTATWSA